MLQLYRANSKTILYLIGIVGIIGIVAFSALYFFSGTFNQHNLVNQLAVSLGLRPSVTPEESLINRRKTRYQQLAINHPFPRVLNNEYITYHKPHKFFRELEALLSNDQASRTFTCDNANLRASLACFLFYGDTDKSQLNKLINAFINFEFSESELGDDAISANWQYAYLYDIARAVANFNTRDIEQINTKIAIQLRKQLKVLEQNEDPLWGSKSSIAANAFLLASVLEFNNTENKALFSRAYWQFLDVLDALETSPIWPQGYSSWLINNGIETSLALSALMNHPESELRQRTYNILNELGFAHIHLTRPDGYIPHNQDIDSLSGITVKNMQVIDIIAKATNNDDILKYSVWLKAKYGDQFKAIQTKTSTRYTFDNFFVSQQRFSEPYTSVQAADLSFLDASLAPAKVFGNNGVHDAFFRTNWSIDASYIHIIANPLFTPLQQHGAGHFTLFKHVPLIASFAVHAHDKSNHKASFIKRTLSKNSILIKPTMKQEKLHENADGGQRTIAPTKGNISRFKDWYRNVKNNGDYYTGSLVEANVDSAPHIVSIDLSPAYNNKHEASRRFIYLPKEDAFVVNDLVKTQNNDHEVKSIFHMLKRPIIDGSQRVIAGTLLDGISQSMSQEFKVQVNDVSLYADVVLPLNAKLTIVGGDSYQYYVDEKSALDKKDITLQAESLRNKPPPMWRLELSEEFSSSIHKSLLVLQARLSKTPKSKVNYYINEDSLSIFTVGETLILHGDIPAQHDFFAMHKISQILILSSSNKLKYTISSVDDCNSFTQAQSTAFSALFNVQVLGKVSVHVSDVNTAENRCWN